MYMCNAKDAKNSSGREVQRGKRTSRSNSIPFIDARLIVSANKVRSKGTSENLSECNLMKIKEPRMDWRSVGEKVLQGNKLEDLQRKQAPLKIVFSLEHAQNNLLLYLQR